MRKEVGVYLSVGVLVLLGLFIAYLLNVGLTGYAVFQQANQGDFDAGVYANTLYNGSNVVLNSSANATSGTYTSRVFDANGSVNWNNLTWLGSVPAGTSVSFQVRNCSAPDCSGSNFVTAGDLNNLNLMGQYFQYQASFSGQNVFDNTTNTTTLTSPLLSSVTLSSSQIPPAVVTSATISEPSGQKSSGAGISVQFTATGSSDIQCQYSVHDASTNAVIIGNTSSGCNTSSTFNLASDGNYVLNLYVSGSSGSAFKTSSFTVSTQTQESEEEETVAEEEIESTVQIPLVPVAPTLKKIELTATDIADLTINPNSSQGTKLAVTNTGTEPVSACVAKPAGALASWISVSADSQNINPGEAKEFAFTVAIPENIPDGANLLTISVECAETAVSRDFSVNIVNKKLELEVVSAERTRQNRVRVVYSLSELSGIDQEVHLEFSIFDSGNQRVANSSQNRTLDANETGEFSANVPINESLNGSYTLKTDFNSQIYSSSLTQKDVILGAPVGGFLGGFAIFEGLGTGGSVLLIAVALALVTIFFVVRGMRKSGKTLKDVFNKVE